MPRKPYNICVCIFLLFIVCCKKRSEENPNPQVRLSQKSLDSIEFSQKLLTEGAEIINKELASLEKGKNSIDIKDIIANIKKIKGITNVELSPTQSSFKIEKEDGSTQILLLNVRDNSKKYKIGPNLKFTSQSPKTTFATTAPLRQTFPKSKKALILAPFQWSFKQDLTLLTRIYTDAGYSVDLFQDDEVTVDIFKGDFLSQYGIIYISTHGIYDPKHGTTLMTGEQDLVNSPLKHIFDFDIRSVNVPKTYKNYFSINKNYIQKSLSRQFPDSWIFIDACYSTFALDMTNFFLQNGAKAVNGYKTSIPVGLANTIVLAMTSYMGLGTDTKTITKHLQTSSGLYKTFIDSEINSEEIMSVNSLTEASDNSSEFRLFNFSNSTESYYAQTIPHFGPGNALVRIAASYDQISYSSQNITCQIPGSSRLVNLVTSEDFAFPYTYDVIGVLSEDFYPKARIYFLVAHDNNGNEVKRFSTYYILNDK